MLTCLLIGWMCCGLPVRLAAGRWEPGESLAQAFAQLSQQMDALDQQVGYGLEPAYSSLMGAKLAPNADAGFRRTFRQGDRYALVAGASAEAEDIRIEIYDSEQELVGQDRISGPRSAMLFQPRTSGDYTIRLRLTKARTDCVALLAVLSDKAEAASTRELKETLQHLLGSCQAMARRAECRLAASDNQWAIWGSMLPPRRSLRISNVRLGSGMKAILAASRDSQSNIDLSLSQDAEELHSDSEPDHKPIIFHRTDANQRYSVQLVNRDSARPVFVLSIALDVEVGR